MKSNTRTTMNKVLDAVAARARVAIERRQLVTELYDTMMATHSTDDERNVAWQQLCRSIGAPSTLSPEQHGISDLRRMIAALRSGIGVAA